MADTGGVFWDDDELRASVEGYLYLLRLEHGGIRCREGAADKVLRAGPLVRRNEGSIRYRMRNISAVIQDKGGPILSAYSPAAQVGSGVRARIGAILDNHPIFRDLTSGPSVAGAPQAYSEVDKITLLQKLAALRQDLEDFERQLANIGHNHPPELIGPEPPRKEEIGHAKSAIDDLSIEISKPTPDAKVAADRLRRLTDFGLKVALWLSERATKFVDVALATAAPIAVLTATDLPPKLIDVVRDVGKFLGLS